MVCFCRLHHRFSARQSRHRFCFQQDRRQVYLRRYCCRQFCSGSLEKSGPADFRGCQFVRSVILLGSATTKFRHLVVGVSQFDHSAVCLWRPNHRQRLSGHPIFRYRLILVFQDRWSRIQPQRLFSVGRCHHGRSLLESDFFGPVRHCRLWVNQLRRSCHRHFLWTDFVRLFDPSHQGRYSDCHPCQRFALGLIQFCQDLVSRFLATDHLDCQRRWDPFRFCCRC